MDFILNELSLKKYSNNEEAIKCFMEMSNVASALSSIGFKVLKIWDRKELMGFHFSNDFIIPLWLKQKRYSSEIERTKSRILNSLLTKHTNWSDEELNVLSNCPLISFNLKNTEYFPQGFKIAAHYNTISISFNTDNIWNESFIELIHLVEDENKTIFEQTISVKHASTTKHFDEQNQWLSSLISKGRIGSELDYSKNYFPHIMISNLIVDDNWVSFRKEIQTNQQEKEATIIRHGELVASRNGYQKEKAISKRNTTNNKKRIVFGAGIGCSKIYLSIDLEKGGFEVCDYLGEHIGEYFFDGSLQSGKKFGHNLIVKS